MSNSKDSFRIDIRIDRASVRRALVVGGSLVLMATAGIVFYRSASIGAGGDERFRTR